MSCALAAAGPAGAQDPAVSPAGSAPGPAPVPDARWLEEQVGSWYRGASRRAPGEWGIAIADENGAILWGLNADRPLVPASTVKVFTTGFARSVLGGSARRPTRVVGAGAVEPASGEWAGSWGLELNGDPSLERGPGEGPTLYELALQLASGGVRQLTGPLHVQSTEGPADAVYPEVWSRRHQGRLFAPPVGPLTLHENVVWVTVEPGRKSGIRPLLVDASPDGILSLVTVRATTRAGRRSRLSLQPRADGGWTLVGTIGTRARTRRITAVMRDPKSVLNVAWARALQRAGIQWDATQPGATPLGAAPRVLAEVSSPPLDSLASEINRRSLNYGAELLLQWAGGRERGAERLAAHVREVTGGAGEGLRLVDGSGLSYDDRVAPATFVSYLATFPAMPAGRNFPQLLAANGSGTLHRLSSGFPGEGVVRAKTGTLGHVASVVGYLGRPDGVLIVALIYNGRRVLAARQAQWRLFRLLGADGVIIPSDSVPDALEPVLGGEEADVEADSA
ncbi:MAG TPA: D-alanyl-D-alanine carboxypeptidase/D-alanyl-D-alanine-endopeptidase [Gemmatimonadales bacterium]|nr:D-alanyl-D-alanine carboxypeptidase/D-alanyl-D-alanine-endopeptidase [Gemmatimonadales bacterium]